MRPLFTYLHAVVVPTGVFAATDDFADPRFAERVERAAGELVALLAPRAGTRKPAVSTDPFDDVTPFDQLLKGR